MKKTVLVLLVLIGVLLAGSVLATPAMKLSEESFDFGYAPQNSTVTHEFWIHSTGDDSLKILKVVPG